MICCFEILFLTKIVMRVRERGDRKWWEEEGVGREERGGEREGDIDTKKRRRG